VLPSRIKKLVAQLLVRQGPTSHFTTAQTGQERQDTIEIPGTEILGRIFTSATGGRGSAKIPAKRFLVVALLVLKKWVSSEAF
jgi:hypothetical protein